MDEKKLTKIATICAAVLAVACFLPWVSVSTPLGGDSSNVLSEGFTMGWLILVTAAVAAVILVARMTGNGKSIPLPDQKQKLLALACMAVAALFTIINFFKDYPSLGPVEVSRGFGQWLGVLTSIGGTVTLGMTMKTQLKDIKEAVASAVDKDDGDKDDGDKGDGN